MTSHIAPSDCPLWEPSAAAVAASNMTAFMALVNERHGLRLTGYAELHAWSISMPAAFWDAIWDYAGVIGEKGDIALADGDRMPGARFFPEARLNFAENLLRTDGADPVLLFNNEGAMSKPVGAAELRATVARFAAVLRGWGVGPGDRVAAFMPNCPETIVAMLAAASIGAVFSSCSPDFGVRGVLDRFGQIGPRVLIACDGYRYAGKVLPAHEKLAEIVAGLPTLEHVAIVPFIGEGPKDIPKAEDWSRLVANAPATPLHFERLPFAHPLYIMYSSGTTGVPKCIVHSAGGTLLQHLKEHKLHCDIKAGETLFYFTTCGWMMWNWLVSGLAAGATLALYDGSPFAPNERVLFDYIDAAAINVFGTSAKFIDAVKKSGLRPRETHDLSSMRMILSTGSPLVPESFNFVYEDVKNDVALCSISGGTDIVSCFVLGSPVLPVYRGEIQARGLGMAVEVWDEAGEELRPGQGEASKGELVCTKPFPSMPIGFWNDESGTKYRAAYFDRFPGVWCHGDFAEITAHDGIVIHGRSDATLNPGGVRIGTAEIYAQVEQLPEVQEALAIGQDWQGDVRVVLFVVMKPGVPLDEAMERRIRTRIRDGASPRHVPAKIVAVSDIPRTKSGKITELAVRDIVHGRDVKNREALANPEALSLYRDLPELST
ncbi:acetoacetate--CoA ligase [Parvibaculum sp.]|uniref:acetoacetate--CoA ligase n=1 Tax=Parvibaculum sp. TaxID=2024848 RepID=UPI00272F501A|nr:acetoacetate--CoA ligase [Parvibaculum sp.]MDP1626597.1 acetoacetate--CoA ligase [Parvibaculum sp.]MDP2150519.1 acetoacetate--CoA ligase [Parvibaculum sp.]MDP3327149.1 acetoacetate--CoA ligase [Parvibaculum sp.]